MDSSAYTAQLGTIIALLIAFQLKHLLADFIFQTPFMLQKSKPGWS